MGLDSRGHDGYLNPTPTGQQSNTGH